MVSLLEAGIASTTKRDLSRLFSTGNTNFKLCKFTFVLLFSFGLIHWFGEITVNTTVHIRPIL